MKSLGKWRHLRRAALLIIAVACAAPARSAEPLLTEPELIEISIRAFHKNPAALRRLVREHQRYQKALVDEEILTAEQTALYSELSETLQLLSPSALAAPKPQRKKVVVQEPAPTRPFPAPKRDWETEPAGDDPVDDPARYFEFVEGSTLLYSGRKKMFTDKEWSESGKTLKSHVLEVKEKRRVRRIRLLEEVQTAQDWLTEQALVTLSVSPHGAQIRKEVVFNQPESGVVAPVGRQESRWIAQFPLKGGYRAGDYIVESLAASVETPAGKYARCLLLKGPLETLAFAPGLGLVRMERFNERWSLKEKWVPEEVEASSNSVRSGPLSRKERRALEKSVRSFCKGKKMKLKSLLWARASAPEEGTGRTVRTGGLAYGRALYDPDQSRYVVLRQEWKEIKTQGKTRWVLTASEGTSPF